MYDHVVILDETLRCPHGHAVTDFQTKSFADAAMDTYILEGSRVHRVARGPLDDADRAVTTRWILEGRAAVFERRHVVEPVVPPQEIVFYTTCDECAPVLVRGEHRGLWGDLVNERRLWVEFRVTYPPNGGRHLERVSGTRDELGAELRREGLRVLRDDEPLAIAHREVRAAQDRGALRGRRRLH